MRTIGIAAIGLIAGSLVSAAPALAQTRSEPDWLRIEGQVGTLSFIEDSHQHLLVGGGAQFALTPRLAAGVEVTWFRGPGQERGQLVLGVLNVDLGPMSTERRVQPYFLTAVGGGQSRDSTLTTSGALIDFGGGARIAVGDRWYVAPEARFGWAAHLRFGVNVGWALR